ncbi:MAG: methionine--tRNA ligase [Deltaproteobacteria bacterium]|nr:methionine--tRNA ligase [Deltaproteobacteria bacterium]
MEHFFLSTPIYYVNARPHLGHAYTTIVADAVSRFHRLAGEEVFFLTGTDEHGDKIVKAAEAGGQSPQEYADQISGLFRDLWPRLDARPDRFIRTTEDSHKKVVQAVLQRVFDRGDIYFDEYGGHYCFGCERFYTEKELVDGLCPDHKTKPEFIREQNYFFRMSAYLDRLREHVERNPDFIRPERYRNEVLGLLREDLGDLCISRPKSRLTWGVELPFDDRFVTYVWFDALINYISALDWPDGKTFAQFWPGARHLVAKDILKPHAVFWPTMLMAAGIPLYKGLRVHGYWTVAETKMSKSLGNVVEPLGMAEKYGVDSFRYFLLREMQFGSDASFSEEALVQRLNSDLANDLGNLFSRVLTMTHKYFGGTVPDAGPMGEVEAEVVALGRQRLRRFQEHFGEFQPSLGLDGLWDFVRALNKYVDQSAPWQLHKVGDTRRLGTVLRLLLEGMRKIALHLWPVMPEASKTMLGQLGVILDLKQIDLAGELEDWQVMLVGSEVADRSNVFPRRELEKPEPVKGKEHSGPKSAQAVQFSPIQSDFIEFSEFQQIDLRVGTVVSALPVPKADRLLSLLVDLGETEPRPIVAGLADHWTPEAIKGRQVVVVANLKPRKLMGQESRGMVLAVKTESGMALLGPSSEVSAGSKVS